MRDQIVGLVIRATCIMMYLILQMQSQIIVTFGVELIELVSLHLKAFNYSQILYWVRYTQLCTLSMSRYKPSLTVLSLLNAQHLKLPIALSSNQDGNCTFQQKIEDLNLLFLL